MHPFLTPPRGILTSKNQLPASSCWRSVQLKVVLFRAALSGNTACTLVVLVSSSSCMRNGTPSALTEEAEREALCCKLFASYPCPIPATLLG